MTFLIGAGSFGCLVGICICLFSMGTIVKELNHLHAEVLEEMDDYKSMADDTWFKLIGIRMSSGDSGKTAITTVFDRQKRQDDVCHCDKPSNVCPPGPRGPPGRPGNKGLDGLPGNNGLDGAPGVSLAVTHAIPGGCIKCPPGPPGPPGYRGLPGPAGAPGLPGMPGPPGESFRYRSPPGPPGDMGLPGLPGKPGTPGKDGFPGVNFAPGVPGPAGRPGLVGAPGPAGKDGPVGYPGSAGPPGRPGADGKDGEPGLRGPPGFDGMPGSPGNDATYCPCPQRTSRVVKHTKLLKKDKKMQGISHHKL